MAKKGDTVYVLGDFAFQDHNHYLMALNSRKVLIKGNHDAASQEVYKNFTEVHEFGCERRIEGYNMVFCHYGLKTWRGSYGGKSFHAYGHSHGRLPEFDNMLCCDVGVDVWGYSICPWECFLQKMLIKEEWIKKNGKYPVDGETKAEGQYDKDPEVRVLETRAKNKEIIKSLGYPIIDEMWPSTLLET
jgi:calcineurin-like phosphoesterase family protein